MTHDSGFFQYEVPLMNSLFLMSYSVGLFSVCFIIGLNLFHIALFSGVPNKRGEVRIIGGGGWKWFNITVIGGLE